MLAEPELFMALDAWHWHLASLHKEAPAAAAAELVERRAVRAIGVGPDQLDLSQVIEVAEPARSDGAVLVRGWLLGVSGTDAELVVAARWQSRRTTPR